MNWPRMHADARRMKTCMWIPVARCGGGQWQVLYLVERLKDAVLLAPRIRRCLRRRGNEGWTRGAYRSSHCWRLRERRTWCMRTMRGRTAGGGRGRSSAGGFAAGGISGERRHVFALGNIQRRGCILAVSKFVAKHLEDAVAPGSEDSRGVRRRPDSSARVEPSRVGWSRSRNGIVMRYRTAGVPVHFVDGFMAGSFYGERVRVLERNGRARFGRAGGDGVRSSGDRQPRGRVAGIDRA